MECANFVLREVEGLSTAETAEALNVSEDVVKTGSSARARGAAPPSLGPYRRNGSGSLPVLPASVRPSGCPRARSDCR